MNYLLVFLFILPTSIIIIWTALASGMISVLDRSIEKWAQVGDFFGGTLNPIFAYLALIALLYTIKLQLEALKMSKEELKATRKELTESRIAQQEQSKSLELQNKATELQLFENTFFQMINLFIETRNNLTTHETINVFSQTNSAVIINTYLKELITYSSYNDFNDKYEMFTGSYFGQIYQIIKFIDDSLIENKKRYINIFRAQFTKNELELLFYHGLGDIGKRRFKELIENYEFFEHISLNNKIKMQILEYNISSFGKNEKILKYIEENKSKNSI